MRVDKIEGVIPFRCALFQDARGVTIQTQLWDVWHPNSGVTTQPRICVVHNPLKGTLRGLHYQQPGIVKIVICTMGVVFDVLADMRPDSSTYLKWASFQTMTWSRHSRRIEPISRSTCPFCQGERGGMG